MTKTPEEIAIEVFEKGEDGMTPILTRLEIAASLGIAEGRATLAKELLERHNKIANFKLGQTLPNWAVEIVGRETAKAVKAEVKEVQISESRNGQDDAPAADISEEDAENLAKLAVIGELKKLGVIKKEATKTK